MPKNAYKPPAELRQTLAVRVHPTTLKIIQNVAKERNTNHGRAVDFIVGYSAKIISLYDNEIR